MLSDETIEKYRRMTPGQRLSMTLQMTLASTPYMSQGSPELVARRFALLQRENDLRNQNMLRAIAESGDEP